MLTEGDRAVLNEAYRSCVRGTETINMVLDQCQESRLALDLNRQSCRLVTLGESVEKIMESEQEKPQKDPLGRIRNWAVTKRKIMGNSDAKHTAEVMIRKNTEAIVNTMKVLKANKNIKKEYYEIAEEVMDFEEKCIESLKAYLK